MEKKYFIAFFISGLILFSSCSSYLISVDSLKEQFAGMDSTKLKNVNVRGPIGETYSYLANSIQSIKCKDKNGKPHELINSPSIEVRITYSAENKSKRTVFYFDRLYLNNWCMIGVQSRFISSIKKTIPLNDVSKIEIQDGRKNFHYIKQKR